MKNILNTKKYLIRPHEAKVMKHREIAALNRCGMCCKNTYQLLDNIRIMSF